MTLFASEEWAELLKDGINASKEMAKAGKGFDATIQWIIQGAGERGDLLFWTHLKDGKICELDTGDKKCDYTVAGDYAVWKEIADGHQDPLQAIMLNKIAFEGDMQVIMRYIKAVNCLMDCVKDVPSEF